MAALDLNLKKGYHIQKPLSNGGYSTESGVIFMAYRKETLLAKISEAAQDMDTFYQQRFLNWTGFTSDDKVRYTEVTAAYLLEHPKLLERICCVGRGSYLVSHTPSLDAGGYRGPRKEEHLAQVLKGKTLDGLGEIKEYQVPLKRSAKDEGVGKIDLVSVDGSKLYVIELKVDTSEETLLRCAMEVFTYCRQANREQLMKDYHATEIVPAVLVGKGGAQEAELREKPANLIKFLKQLGVEVFFYAKTETGEYVCERAEY